jgi:voltage-gated sodium channel
MPWDNAAGGSSGAHPLGINDHRGHDGGLSDESTDDEVKGKDRTVRIKPAASAADKHTVNEITEVYDNEKRRRELKPTIVDSLKFNLFCLIAVILNCATIGFEIDWHYCDKMLEECAYLEDSDSLQNNALSIDNPLPRSDPIWKTIETIFLLFFAVECGTRLFFHSDDYCKRWRADWMNWFDVVIVAISFIDLQLQHSFKVFSLFRVVRLARLARLVRLFRMFKELYLFVAGWTEVVKTFVWVLPILMLFIFVFGIFFTEFINPCLRLSADECERAGGDDFVELYPDPDRPLKARVPGDWTRDDYFSSVSSSMLTLFQVVTLDGWSTKLARPLLATHAPLCLLFIGFILLTHYGILNVIVGVVCESMIQIARQNDARVAEMVKTDTKQLLSSLRQAFSPVHTNNGQEWSINREDFMKQMNKRSVREILACCEIPVHDVEDLFDILDADGSGDITWDEFFEGCQLIKGQARGEDLFHVSQFVAEALDKTDQMYQRTAEQSDKLDEVCETVDQIWKTYYDPCRHYGKQGRKNNNSPSPPRAMLQDKRKKAQR